MFIKIFFLVCVLQKAHTVSSLETTKQLSSHENQDEDDEASLRVRRQIQNSKFEINFCEENSFVVLFYSFSLVSQLLSKRIEKKINLKIFNLIFRIIK